VKSLQTLETRQKNKYLKQGIKTKGKYMKEIESCKGCYRERVNACVLLCQNLYINKSQDTDEKPKNCPCMICLIKVVCSIPCEDRDEFWQHEYDRLYIEESKYDRAQKL
jgi:hypothetical protein